MVDKVYMKVTNGGLIEKNPHLAFGIGILVSFPVYMIVSTEILCILPDIPVLSGVISVIGLIAYMLGFVFIFLYLNQRHNMSASTAFILRDDKLYAVQLLYTKKELGTETDRSFIYTTSGDEFQAATLANNFEVARNVQAHEHEVRDRRMKSESFSFALDDLLRFCDKYPNVYPNRLPPDSKRTKLDKLFMWGRENDGLVYIETVHASYKFLKLIHPRIIKQNRKYFIVEFYSENNEVCTAKFTNCYGTLPIAGML